jgi:ubiquitin carboxyl-terminal hydrolase 10
LGFYLDTLEDELLTILNALQPPAVETPAPADNTEPGPHDVGWMEVGKKNRVAVTRTVSHGVPNPTTSR